MNRELVKILAQKFEGTDLSEIEKAKSKMRLFKKENLEFNQFSDITLIILIVCINFKKNEEMANKLLIGLIPEASVDDLTMIFKKVTTYTEEYIEYCKNQQAKIYNCRYI